MPPTAFGKRKWTEVPERPLKARQPSAEIGSATGRGITIIEGVRVDRVEAGAGPRQRQAIPPLNSRQVWSQHNFFCLRLRPFD